MTLHRDAVPVLDVDATPLTVDGLMSTLQGFIDGRSLHMVAGHNLHSVTLCHRDRSFREFYDQCDVVLLDGAPVVWLWNRKAQVEGSPMNYRLGSTDWIPALGRLSELHRVAVLGAGQEANDGAVAKLAGFLPDAEVKGMPGQGWNASTEEAALVWLNDFKPQLVLIGLGMPLQEQVLQRRRSQLPAAIYCSVGGAIEQVAGVQRLAPRWLGRLGLEWAWRLLLHPTRVAYRVFIEPWQLVGLLIRRRIGFRA